MANKYNKTKKGSRQARNLVDNISQLSNDPSSVLGIGKEVIQGLKNGGVDGALGALKDHFFGGGADEDKFLATVASRGGLAKSRFIIEFNIPVHSAMAPYNKISRDAVILCKTCNLPDRQLLTTETTFEYGRPKKLPYAEALSDIDFTFHLTQDMKMKSLFDDWMSIAISPTTGRGNYLGDYAVDLGIIVQDIQNQEIYKIKLIDAYPINITSVPLTHDANALLEVGATMTYSRIEYISSQSSDFTIFGINIAKTAESIIPGSGNIIRNISGAYKSVIDFF